jgi:hypothetical protein
MERSHRVVDDPMQSDTEVLLAIRDALRSVYEDVLKQPIPRNVRAVLSRLEDESHFEPFSSMGCADDGLPPSQGVQRPSGERSLPPTGARFRHSAARPCTPLR